MTDPFEVSGVTFQPYALWSAAPSTSTAFWVGKDPELFDAWLEVLEPHRGGAIVEVGIFEGGSTALCALTIEPERVVCIDIQPEVHPALAGLIEREGLGDRVHVHTGVDQADRERVRAIIEQEFGDRPLDLVVDDASHFYDETVATFEVLFPRLRPGGVYVIEDWTWEVEFVDRVANLLADAVAREELGPQFASAATDPNDLTSRLVRDLCGIASVAASRGEEAPWAPVFATVEGETPTEPSRPLAHLIQQLVLSQATATPEVAAVRVNRGWAEIVRGDLPIDPETFRVDDLYVDRYGLFGAPDVRARGEAAPRP
jgi:predicted O-methyltransferase YrrM